MGTFDISLGSENSLWLHGLCLLLYLRLLSHCGDSRCDNDLALLSRYGADVLAYLFDLVIEGSLFMQVPELIGVGLGLEVALKPRQLPGLPSPLVIELATSCQLPTSLEARPSPGESQRSGA
jgi:hypothetical protein